MKPQVDSTSKVNAAKVALARWGGDTLSRQHFGASPSTVFKAKIAGRDHALRLTEPAFRTRGLIEAECDFVDFLASRGISVVRPIRSVSGNWVEEVSDGTGPVYASVASWAPGSRVEAGSPMWTESFIRAWGRSLGTIHTISVSYQPRVTRRWHWREEGWIANAENLFDPADEDVRRVFASLLSELASIPEKPGEFGLIHGDHWPQNFNYDEAERITHFDFENCRYHWFLADAISGLSILRRLDGDRAGNQCDWFLEAYQERFELAPAIWDHRVQLLRLQRFYAYLSRLDLFSKPVTEEQQQTLFQLRQKALQAIEW